MCKLRSGIVGLESLWKCYSKSYLSLKTNKLVGFWQIKKRKMGSVIFKVLNYFYVTNQISMFVIDQVMFDYQVSTVPLWTFKIWLFAFIHGGGGDNGQWLTRKSKNGMTKRLLTKRFMTKRLLIPVINCQCTWNV